MTTDVLTETVLDEVEAVMRAEWVRLQDDNALCERTVCSETPPPGPAPCTAGTYRTALSNGGDAPNDDHEWAVTRASSAAARFTVQPRPAQRPTTPACAPPRTVAHPMWAACDVTASAGSAAGISVPAAGA